jgi:hypothetical protein
MQLRTETGTKVQIFPYYPTKKTGQGRAGHAKTLAGQGRVRLSRHEQGRLQVTKNS